MSIQFLPTLWPKTGKNSQYSIHLLCLALDRVGRNVAAGMTGGLAYILDEDDTLIPKVRI